MFFLDYRKRKLSRWSYKFISIKSSHCLLQIFLKLEEIKKRAMQMRCFSGVGNLSFNSSTLFYVCVLLSTSCDYYTPIRSHNFLLVKCIYTSITAAGHCVVLEENTRVHAFDGVSCSTREAT